MTTRVVENRDLALKIGYAATDWNYPITFDEHASRAEGWEVRLIERDGNPIGAIFEKDGEVHCSILPEWRRRWLTKGLLRQIVGGPAFHTRVDDGHDYMYGILERLGMTRGPDGVVRKVS
jgi:hypothetical protein